MRYELTDDESAGTQERASTIGDQTGHSDRITRANIDRFLNRLENANDGSILHKMILAEELARDTEHLEFAESRTLGFRERYDRLANWRDSFPLGTPDRAQADRVLADTVGRPVA